MSSFTSRNYAGREDLQLMINLLVAVRPTERITDYPSIIDLHEMLALTNVQNNTRLWFNADDQIIGFAYVDPYHNLRFEFDRQAVYPNIEMEIINWGTTCIQRTMAKSGESLTLDASCRDDDAERIELLERHGFVIQEVRSLHMVRSLNQPIPKPTLPKNFHIRHVAGEHEVGKLVTLHQTAFGTKYMTIEERLAMMRIPEYDAGLDLLVIAPNGRFAATCFCSISQEENKRTGRNEGYTDPIATHPGFQRQGLAQALLLAGFDKLKQRGMETAVLGTSNKNIAMQKTASAVGFHIQSSKLWFEKAMP